MAGRRGHAQSRVFTGTVWMLWRGVRRQGTRAEAMQQSGLWKGVGAVKTHRYGGTRQDSLVNPKSTHAAQGKQLLGGILASTPRPGHQSPHMLLSRVLHRCPKSTCKPWEWVKKSSLSTHHQEAGE